MVTTSNARLTVRVSVPLPKLISRKFDEFPDISRNDEKARLDNFGIELQNDPTATAYVIVYPGRSSKRGEVQHHASRIVDYLVNSRGLDQSRIVTLVGPQTRSTSSSSFGSRRKARLHQIHKKAADQHR